MEPQEKLTSQQIIMNRLHEIHKQVEANDFVKALEAIKEVKAEDSKNIYVIAIEKQIAKLNDQVLSENDKTEIIESLPAMIERAVNDAQRRTTLSKVIEQKPKEKDQKEVALEKLKNQYIQRAAEYIGKQEYQHALEEVKRIYIIEPDSKVAKEYERKISQLMELHAREETKVLKEKAIDEPIKAKEPTIKEAKEKPVAVREPELVTEKNVELVLEEEPPKSKLPIYIAIAAVVIIIVGVVVWWIFSRKPSEAQIVQPEQTPPAMQTETSSTPSGESTTSALTNASESSKTPSTAKNEKDTKSTKTTEKAETKSTKPIQETKPVTVAPVTKQASSATEKKPADTKPVTTSPSQSPTETAKTPEGEIPQVFVAIESPPKIVKRGTPVYPDFAIKLGLEGKVVVEVTVDPQGRPIQAKIKKTDNEIFNDAAIEAAMKSTYEPGMMSTGPVTASILVPFSFKLKK